MSVHVFFITQDYVLVFYWDAENAEASGADDKAADYVLVFWQNKDEKERKKITAYRAFSNRSILFHDSTSYYTGLTFNFCGCFYRCA